MSRVGRRTALRDAPGRILVDDLLLEARFGVVVPVKPPAVAKSRLGGLGDDVRRALASAFAADTVEAALASERVACVLVVTDDHGLARDLADPGVEVIPDGAADDLNASLVQAAAELHPPAPRPADRRALRGPARPAPRPS